MVRETHDRAGEASNMKRHRAILLLSGLTTVLACGWAGMMTARGQQPPQYAGAVERGFLLPNGWTITPGRASRSR